MLFLRSALLSYLSSTGLRQGERGAGVRELQRILHDLGIQDGQGRPLAIDGIFGPSTRQAVENLNAFL